MNLYKTLIIIFVCLLQTTLFSQTTFSESLKDSQAKTVLGYGILSRFPGQWNGPVTSTTPAGSFDKWYIDFRPVSQSQISQFSLLDSQTVNNISFFVVKYKEELRVAMRTEGCFAKKCCVTYEMMDSVNEKTGYYRFSDFQSGAKRAYTEFTFSEDKFVMRVYTNKFNKVDPLQIHTEYTANLVSRKSSEETINKFDFPQPVMVKDFTDVFEGMTESIFFNLDNDPYSSYSQPNVGSVTVDISIDPKLKTKSSDELCLFLTTESLFEGLKYIPENLNYLSKYVYLPSDTKSFTIKNVHPGKYYLYSFSDLNNDKKHLSGDYMSSRIDNVIVVPENGNVKAETKIDLVIP